MISAHDLLPGSRLVFVHQVAFVIGDTRDGHRRHALAAIGKHPKSRGHIEQGHFAPAQRERQAIVLAVECIDSQPPGKGDQAALIIYANVLERLYGGDIVRVCQRSTHCHRPVVALVIIHRLVRFAGIIWITGRWKFAGYIPDQRGRRPALLEGCHIGKRLDRRAGLARRDRHVDLTSMILVVEIGRADHGKNLPSSGADGNQRAIVCVMLFQRFHLLADGLLGPFLDLRIQRGIYVETRAIDRLWVVLGLEQ